MSFSLILSRLGIKGASTVGGSDQANKLVVLNSSGLLDDSITSEAITDHIEDTANPHSVTKSQVGLGNCDNTSDVNKPISTLTQAALDLKANSSSLTSHISDNDKHLTSAQNTWIDAITASATEINYLVGTTSGIQDQLDAKPDINHVHEISDVTDLETILDTKASLAANTFTANQIINGNGDAYTPSLKINGTIFTGGSATTTKPLVLIEPAGTTSTAWSTAGTALGINVDSSFTGRLLELQKNSVSSVYIRYDGLIHSEFGIETSNIYNVGGGIVAAVGSNILGTGYNGFSVVGAISLSSGAVALSGPAAWTLQLGIDHASSPSAQTLKAHNVTTGTGASLTLAGGTGSVAGGAVILATSTTTGSATARMTISAAGDMTISSASASGVAGIHYTGTTFTGGSSTTTKPLVLIEPTGTTSNSWHTSGTMLAVNAASGFAGNILDLQVSGNPSVTLPASNGRMFFSTFDSPHSGAGVYIGSADGTESAHLTANQGLNLSKNLQIGWVDAFNTAATPTSAFTWGASAVVKLFNPTSAAGAAQEFVEMTAPSAPSANAVRLYAEDNGSGKTRLMALFPTGSAQQVAIEP